MNVLKKNTRVEPAHFGVSLFQATEVTDPLSTQYIFIFTGIFIIFWKIF